MNLSSRIITTARAAALLLACIPPAGAATRISSALIVSAVVLPPPAACVVGASHLAFGQYLGARTDATSAISVACTGPAPYHVGLAAAPGAAPSFEEAELSLRGGEMHASLPAGRIAAPGATIHLIIATISY